MSEDELTLFLARVLEASPGSDEVRRVVEACREKRYHTSQRLIDAAFDGADDELFALGFAKADVRHLRRVIAFEQSRSYVTYPHPPGQLNEQKHQHHHQQAQPAEDDEVNLEVVASPRPMRRIVAIWMAGLCFVFTVGVSVLGIAQSDVDYTGTFVGGVGSAVSLIGSVGFVALCVAFAPVKPRRDFVLALILSCASLFAFLVTNGVVALIGSTYYSYFFNALGLVQGIVSLLGAAYLIAMFLLVIVGGGFPPSQRPKLTCGRVSDVVCIVLAVWIGIASLCIVILGIVANFWYSALAPPPYIIYALPVQTLFYVLGPLWYSVFVTERVVVLKIVALGLVILGQILLFVAYFVNDYLDMTLIQIFYPLVTISAFAASIALLFLKVPRQDNTYFPLVDADVESLLVAQHSPVTAEARPLITAP